MNCEDIESMDKRRRATFINCLSGFKSPFWVGSKSSEGFENLAIFSSIFHLGANPPLIGMISRPNSVPRHTLENIIENGSYSLNLINESFLENAHQTSARYDRQVSEFEACGFESCYQEGFVAPYLENSKLSLFLEAKEIKELEINLHNNSVHKRSDCFWCTCSFDNSPIYIPKSMTESKYNVYGNFCSPECACSFLFNEHIDDVTKFERYQLLNFMYSKAYNYTKNIKPAPNPYYTLDKYMGNLSIKEWRSQLKNDRLLIVVDKPLTKIFPELYEDNNEFEIAVDNKFTFQKKISVNKNEIIKDVFSGSK